MIYLQLFLNFLMIGTVSFGAVTASQKSRCIFCD